jgi:hypothetical protein
MRPLEVSRWSVSSKPLIGTANVALAQSVDYFLQIASSIRVASAL